MTSWLEHAVTDPAGTSRSAVRARLEGLSGDLGLDHFAFVMMQPRNGMIGPPVAITNYPQAWVRRYIWRRYDLIDPVLEAARRTPCPFFWGSAAFLAGLRKTGREMMEAARAYGLCHGLSIPVHCPGHSSGLLVVVTSGEERLHSAVHGAHNQLWAAACDTWAFMAKQVAPVPAGRAHEAARPGAEGPGLTAREKECLQWTAEGRTAQETGALLGLSAFTVNRHVSTATRKLGCVNKHHAACRALITGLITPTPVVISMPQAE